MTVAICADMDTLKRALRTEAVRKYGGIRPLAKKRTLSDCYSIIPLSGKRYIYFWFNLRSGTAKALRRELSN